MQLSSETTQFLKDSVRRFFPDETYKIILFGSYANGMARENSDIDLAIKGLGPLELHKWQSLISFFEESYLPQSVDLIDYHRVTKDFQDLIDREGKEL